MNKTLWGLPIVVADSILTGQLVVGNFPPRKFPVQIQLNNGEIVATGLIDDSNSPVITSDKAPCLAVIKNIGDA